ncbi:4'-phosphopantetheinyl transferase superfamily protein [Aquincola sp. MAHUQ-54]|uniref:4'-phosphopantetheinyl transferase superfamily protein n=1 Tax=Aquincola agrisoli TaxID=3119538 RepID=A0AAW9QDK1_9BURK
MGAPADPLPPRDVHLWWCRADAPPPEVLAHLQREEHARAARFHFGRDRDRHLATRWLVRRVLSHYAPGVPPADWRFADNTWGRPAVAAPVPGLPLHFNVSHSADAVLMVVARHEAIGVDVESHRPGDAAGMAELVFSPAERAWLNAAPPDAEARVDRFLALWTLKESFVKACGQGLSMPLQRFGVLPQPDGGVLLQAPPDIEPHPGAWRFWRGALRPGLPWAVAVRDPHASLRIAGEAFSPGATIPPGPA